MRPESKDDFAIRFMAVLGWYGEQSDAGPQQFEWTTRSSNGVEGAQPHTQNYRGGHGIA
jgi:hypothetical protein